MSLSLAPQPTNLWLPPSRPAETRTPQVGDPCSNEDKPGGKLWFWTLAQPRVQ